LLSALHVVELVKDEHGVSVPVHVVVPVDQPPQSSCWVHAVCVVSPLHGVIVPVQARVEAFQVHPPAFTQ
jgi:hypothetical protein